MIERRIVMDGNGARFFLTLLICGLALECGSAQEQKPLGALPVQPTFRVECRLTVEGTAIDLVAQLKVTNQSPFRVKLLRYNLPADGEMTKSLFIIEREGSRIPYRGKTIKRGPPKEEDYLTLESSQTREVIIPLALAYDFKGHGQYRIRYEALNPQPDGNELGKVTSNSVLVKLSKDTDFRVSR